MKPVLLLRLEGLVALAAATFVYREAGFSWLLFAGLFFLPDVSMLGYLGGNKAGAAVYNAGHTYLLPGVLAAFGWWVDLRFAMAAAFVWVAHIGFDRALGYGLKHASGFKDTHLSATSR